MANTHLFEARFVSMCVSLKAIQNIFICSYCHLCNGVQAKSNLAFSQDSTAVISVHL